MAPPLNVVFEYRKDTDKDQAGQIIPTWTTAYDGGSTDLFQNRNTDGHCPITNCYTMTEGCKEKAD